MAKRLLVKFEEMAKRLLIKFEEMAKRLLVKFEERGLLQKKNKKNEWQLNKNSS